MDSQVFNFQFRKWNGRFELEPEQAEFGMHTRTEPMCFRRDDGLRLLDAYITAAVRSTPPANKSLWRQNLAAGINSR